MLKEIKDCKIELIKQNNNYIIRLFLTLQSKKLFTPIIISTISETNKIITN